LVVIDFEYAGYNTRAFDIGNHFCEWTADYHSDRPSVLHPSRYPTKDEQLNFLEAYVEAEIAMCGYHLTAINIAKYAKKRRSISATLSQSLSNLAFKATEVITKKTANSSAPALDVPATTQGNSAAENDRTIPRKKHDVADGGGGVSKAEILDSMYKEVNKFALTSHIMWGLWGLIQATQSEIEFDYFEYSLQRLTEFRRRRDEFMSL